MVLVLCRYDLPTDQVSLGEYNSWITSDGLRKIVALRGLQEFHAFRDYNSPNPRSTVTLSFKDMTSALQAASSDAWAETLTNSTRWGSSGVELTVLEPSPVFPEPVRPQ